LHDLTWGNRPTTENTPGVAAAANNAQLEHKKKLARQSTLICTILVVLNLALAAAVMANLENEPAAMLTLSVVVVACSLLQMILSLVFIVAHNLQRLYRAIKLGVWVWCCGRTKESFHLDIAGRARATN
jgi:hypothetical protein